MVVGATAAAWSASARETVHDTRYADDFDELWSTLKARYAFFGEKATDWAQVRRRYRPAALTAADDAHFGEIIQRVLNELYDPHTHLINPPPGSPRWPLYDLKVELKAGRVHVSAVLEDSAAHRAGVSPGDQIIDVGGVPMPIAMRASAPCCLRRPDRAAEVYAANAAVAGRRGADRTLTIVGVGGRRTTSLPVLSRPPRPDLEARRLENGVGLIVIRSFADLATVDAFDRALLTLEDAPALLIDVRDNGGGDTAVARPIIGRFIGERRPYARMRRRSGEGLGPAWTETVEPRGPFTWTKPVAVVVGPWSASMAEGFAMGMRSVREVKLVGGVMMGLGAAVFPLRLNRTGLQAQYSAEPIYDLQDRPRWLLAPDVGVPAGSDALLAAALTVL